MACTTSSHVSNRLPFSASERSVVHQGSIRFRYAAAVGWKTNAQRGGASQTRSTACAGGVLQGAHSAYARGRGGQPGVTLRQQGHPGDARAAVLAARARRPRRRLDGAAHVALAPASGVACLGARAARAPGAAARRTAGPG